MTNNSFLNRIPPVTRHLILVNVLVWIVSMFLVHTQGFDLSKYLGLHYFTASDFNAMQLITYMFMHDTRGITHIFFSEAAASCSTTSRPVSELHCCRKVSLP